MVPKFIPAISFLQCSQNLQKKASGLNSQTAFIRFKCLFGVTPLVCEKVWVKLYPSLSSGSQPHHLLWAVLKLKTYATDNVCTVICTCSKKTFLKWTWRFIDKLSQLENVSTYTCIYLFFNLDNSYQQS